MIKILQSELRLTLEPSGNVICLCLPSRVKLTVVVVDSNRGGGAASDCDTDGMMPAATGSSSNAKYAMRATQRSDNGKKQ